MLGTVSWYEPGRGYGFVAPDGGGPEIFVHSSAIVTGGVISQGQRVAFLVVEGEKGPQADHLLPLGAEAAQRVVASDGADGTVTWYDADKGFGFVTPDSGGEDAFVHVRALAGGLAELSEGDRVTFD
ncbi:MAG: cold shock domain-containing protein, partial [Cellulomonas sp.]|nr:cold shock domain-containing protein [Cellulomonas sp.]